MQSSVPRPILFYPGSAFLAVRSASEGALGRASQRGDTASSSLPAAQHGRNSATCRDDDIGHPCSYTRAAASTTPMITCTHRIPADSPRINYPYKNCPVRAVQAPQPRRSAPFHSANAVTSVSSRQRISMLGIGGIASVTCSSSMGQFSLPLQGQRHLCGIPQIFHFFKLFPYILQ